MVLLWPQNGEDPLHPTVALFRAIAECNSSHARRRLLRVRCINSQDDNVEVWEDDVHHVEASDEEGIPAERQDAPLDPPTYISPP